MEDNLVSIILPTYNGEKYICEAIDSIIGQTYTNWELIVVDDCSKDATLQIVNEYSRRDNRIKVIHNSNNCKLPQSLNVGFHNSKGDLLTWTSDDNRFLPNAIEVMQQYFRDNNGTYMVLADMYEIDANGTRIGNGCLQWNEQNLCVKNIVGACFMYTRDVYEKIGDYDVNLFCAEDYDYWIRVEKVYGKIVHIPEILYEYRRHNENLTISKQEFKDKQVIELRKKHMEYILQCVRNDEAALFNLYIDSLDRGCDVDFFLDLIKYIPACQYEDDTINSGKRFIIFGAGTYGEKAASDLGEKAYCFADNNKEKINSVKCGLHIVSFEELVRLSDNYCVMIAANSIYGYHMVKQLLDNRIMNFCTYQYYVWRERCVI